MQWQHAPATALDNEWVPGRLGGHGGMGGRATNYRQNLVFCAREAWNWDMAGKRERGRSDKSTSFVRWRSPRGEAGVFGDFPEVRLGHELGKEFRGT